MIPALIKLPGAPYDVLPPGVHSASLADVGERYATNDQRRWLFEGILEVAKALRTAGCAVMFLDGSFVTSKEHPNDFDGYWDPSGVIPALLDETLLDFENEQAAQKWKYRGEMFIAEEAAGGPAESIKSMFQTDRFTGQPKGILRIKLRGAFA